MEPQDLSHPASATAPDRAVSGVVLASILGVVAAMALTLQAGLAAGSAVGRSTVGPWALAVLSILVGAIGAARNRGHEIAGFALVAVGLPLGAAVVVTLTYRDAMFLALAWMALAAIGYALVTSIIQWGGNLTTEGSKWVSRSQPNSPVPSGLIIGLVFFSVPSDRWIAAGLAGPYFGSLLAVAGIGSAIRRIQGERGATLGRQAPLRWGASLLVALVLATLIAVVAPLPLQRGRGNLLQRSDRPSMLIGVVSGRQGGQFGQAPKPSFRGEGEAPKPKTDPNATDEQDVPVPSETQEPPIKARQESAPPPPPPKPPTPEQQREKAKSSLVLALAIAAGSAVLMFFLARYGERIAAFFRQHWTRFVQRRQAKREQRMAMRAAARREAEIRQIESGLPDLFVPAHQLPEADLYRSLELWVEVLGIERRTGETAHSYLIRASNALNLDRRALDPVLRFSTEWAFSGAIPSEESTQQARRSLESFQLLVSSRLTEPILRERQQAAKRRWAEAVWETQTASDRNG